MSVFYEFSVHFLKEVRDHAIGAHVSETIVAIKDRFREHRMTRNRIGLEPIGKLTQRGVEDADGVRSSARRQEADEELALAAASFLGEERVKELLDRGTRIWCQDCQTSLSLNSFLFDIENTSGRDIQWQPRFSVVDAETNRVQNEFFRAGFAMEPGKRKISLYEWANRLPNSGMKRIVAMNVPEGIKVSAVPVLVVPLKVVT